MAHAVVGAERVIFILPSLHADDWRPARGALEPRDVYFHIDEARRAHRSVRHARVAVALTAPDEFPAGPQRAGALQGPRRHAQRPP